MGRCHAGADMLIRMTLSWALLGGVTAAVAPAAGDDGARFDLGGQTPACHLVVEVEEGGAAAHGKMLRCTDGDGCDGDHAANGSCALQVKVCLESGAAPGCGPDVAADMSLFPDPRLGALAAAIEDMRSQMSPGASETCTPVASVTVPTRGQPGSKLALQLLQRTNGPRK